MAQQQRDLEIRAKLLRESEAHDKQLQRNIQTLRRSGFSYEEIGKNIGASDKELKTLTGQLKEWNTVTVRSVSDLKELVSMPIGEIFGRLKDGTMKFAYSAQLSVGLLATAGKKIFEVFERGALSVNQSSAVLAAQTGAGIAATGVGAMGGRLTNAALQKQILEATNGLQTRFHINPETFKKALGEAAVTGGRSLGDSQTVAAAERATMLSGGLGLDPAQATRFFVTSMLRTGDTVEGTARRFGHMDRQAQMAQMSNSSYVDSVQRLTDLTYQHGVSIDTASRMVTLFGKELVQGRIDIQDLASFVTGIEGQSPQKRAGLALLAQGMGVGGMSGLPTDPLSMMRVMRERAASGSPVVGMAQASQMALRMSEQMGTSFENAAELVLPQIFGSLPNEASSRQAIIEKIRTIGDLADRGAGGDVLAQAERDISRRMGAAGTAVSSSDLEGRSAAIAESLTGFTRVFRDEIEVAARTLTEAIRAGVQTTDWSPLRREISEGASTVAQLTGVTMQANFARMIAEILSGAGSKKGTPD